MNFCQILVSTTNNRHNISFYHDNFKWNNKKIVKRLLEFEARVKEEIKRKYRFGCSTLNMIIQISKNLHDQDFTDLALSVTGTAQVRKFLKESSRNLKNVLVSTSEKLRFFRQTLIRPFLSSSLQNCSFSV